MGETVLSLLVICGFLIVSWGWKLFSAIWLTPRKIEKCLREQGVKGPAYKLYYGNSKEMAISSQEEEAASSSMPVEFSHQIARHILPFRHQVVQKYGKLSVTWLGPNPVVAVMDPEMIKQILNDNTGIIGKPRSNPFAHLLVTGLVDYEGEKWVKHRRLINPAFHLEKLKMMLPAFQTCCNELVTKWQNSTTSKSCELDVWPDMENLTADVISRTAFGSCYEEGRRIFQIQTEQAALFMDTVTSLYIPGSRFLPTKRNTKMAKNHNEVRSILRDLVVKREMAMKAGEVHNDLLGILMESNLKEIQDRHGNSKNVGMTINDVIEECKLFYFAGAETTSAVLTWTMICLSFHRDWQERAREEVLQVFGKGKPNFDDLGHLKIVTMILNEVLRLYPPVIFFHRTNCKHIKFGEVTFPPGVELQIPTLLVHRDRELWGEDANEFNPERFSEGVSKATKNRSIFFPFSLGPRICIGLNFAMIELKLVIAMILQNFSFELSPTYQHVPYVVATLKPKYGAPLIFHKL